jgi:hypothetical protein
MVVMHMFLWKARQALKLEFYLNLSLKEMEMGMPEYSCFGLSLLHLSRMKFERCVKEIKMDLGLIILNDHCFLILKNQVIVVHNSPNF